MFVCTAAVDNDSTANCSQPLSDDVMPVKWEVHVKMGAEWKRSVAQKYTITKNLILVVSLCGFHNVQLSYLCSLLIQFCDALEVAGNLDLNPQYVRLVKCHDSAGSKSAAVFKSLVAIQEESIRKRMSEKLVVKTETGAFYDLSNIAPEKSGTAIVHTPEQRAKNNIQLDDHIPTIDPLCRHIQVAAQKSGLKRKRFEIPESPPKIRLTTKNESHKKENVTGNEPSKRFHVQTQPLQAQEVHWQAQIQAQAQMQAQLEEQMRAQAHTQAHTQAHVQAQAQSQAPKPKQLGNLNPLTALRSPLAVGLPGPMGWPGGSRNSMPPLPPLPPPMIMLLPGGGLPMHMSLMPPYISGVQGMPMGCMLGGMYPPTGFDPTFKMYPSGAGARLKEAKEVGCERARGRYKCRLCGQEKLGHQCDKLKFSDRIEEEGDEDKARIYVRHMGVQVDTAYTS